MRCGAETPGRDGAEPENRLSSHASLPLCVRNRVFVFGLLLAGLHTAFPARCLSDPHGPALLSIWAGWT